MSRRVFLSSLAPRRVGGTRVGDARVGKSYAAVHEREKHGPTSKNELGDADDHQLRMSAVLLVEDAFGTW